MSDCLTTLQKAEHESRMAVDCVLIGKYECCGGLSLRWITCVSGFRCLRFTAGLDPECQST